MGRGSGRGSGRRQTKLATRGVGAGARADGGAGAADAAAGAAPTLAARTTIALIAPTACGKSLPSLLLLLGAVLLATAATWPSVVYYMVDVVQMGLLAWALSYMSRPLRQLSRAAWEKWLDSRAESDARADSPPVKTVLFFLSLMAVVNALAAAGALGHGLEGEASLVLPEDHAVAVVLPSVFPVAMWVGLVAGVTAVFIAILGRCRSIRQREPVFSMVFSTASGEVPVTLPCDTQVSDLKKRMLQAAGIANANVPDGASADQCAEFFLACDGKPLEDNDSLQASGICTGATIQLQVGYLTVKRRARARLNSPLKHIFPLCSPCPARWFSPFQVRALTYELPRRKPEC